MSKILPQLIFPLSKFLDLNYTTHTLFLVSKIKIQKNRTFYILPTVILKSATFFVSYPETHLLEEELNNSADFLQQIHRIHVYFKDGGGGSFEAGERLFKGNEHVSRLG